MTVFTDFILASPATADGFTISVLVMLSAIVALFVAMKNKLRKK